MTKLSLVGYPALCVLDFIPAKDLKEGWRISSNTKERGFFTV